MNDEEQRSYNAEMFRRWYKGIVENWYKQGINFENGCSIKPVKLIEDNFTPKPSKTDSNTKIIDIDDIIDVMRELGG